MTKVRLVDVGPDDDGMRIDRFITHYCGPVPYGVIAKALRTGQVRCDGKRIKPSDRIQAGQQLRLPPTFFIQNPNDPSHGNGRAPGRSQGRGDRAFSRGASQDVKGDRTKADHDNPQTKPVRHQRKPDASLVARIKKSIIFEDQHIIVLNKPAGVAVQGGSGVANGIDSITQELYEDAPKLVHRLDKDTSGLLVLAKTRKEAERLTQAFASKKITKVYHAILVGRPEAMELTISAPLGTGLNGKQEKVVVDEENGKHARTHVTELDHAGMVASLVALEPETGRKHQLRAHMTYAQTPILGDGKYAGQDAFVEGAPKQLCLHAFRLLLPGYQDAFEAPYPEHMKKAMDFFGLTVK